MWKKLGKHFYIAIVLLIVTIFLVQRVPHGKSMPLQKDILTFQDQIGSWKGGPHKPFDPQILDVLRVDDYLNRTYYDENGSWISLYIGYFRDQMSGETIHHRGVRRPELLFDGPVSRPCAFNGEGPENLAVKTISRL